MAGLQPLQQRKNRVILLKGALFGPQIFCSPGFRVMVETTVSS